MHDKDIYAKVMSTFIFNFVVSLLLLFLLANEFVSKYNKKLYYIGVLTSCCGMMERIERILEAFNNLRDIIMCVLLTLYQLHFLNILVIVKKHIASPLLCIMQYNSTLQYSL